MFLTMEDLCNHVNRAGECGCSSKSSTYAQSLSEMDFERGIWQAALNGDVSRVRKFLDKGTDPSSRDGLGYTALVNHVLHFCRGNHNSFFFCHSNQSDWTLIENK